MDRLCAIDNQRILLVLQIYPRVCGYSPVSVCVAPCKMLRRAVRGGAGGGGGQIRVSIK